MISIRNSPISFPLKSLAICCEIQTRSFVHIVHVTLYIEGLICICELIFLTLSFVLGTHRDISQLLTKQLNLFAYKHVTELFPDEMLARG